MQTERDRIRALLKRAADRLKLDGFGVTFGGGKNATISFNGKSASGPIEAIKAALLESESAAELEARCEAEGLLQSDE